MIVMRERQPVVYLLSNMRKGTLYVGVTSHLIKRMWEHRHGIVEGFTKRYGVHRLVWFEQASTMHAAITREKQIKKWNRSWKIELIENANPQWRDLWPEIAGETHFPNAGKNSYKVDSRLRGNDRV